MIGGVSNLSEFYKILGWPEDPYSDAGRKRFENALKFMEILTKHRWIRNILNKRKVIKILDVCGGTGIGGIALTKILLDKGFKVDLFIADLREDALETAQKWGREVLGIEIKTTVIDVRDIYNIGEKDFNIVLLYGLSTPHFNPWDIVKMYVSISRILSKEGLFIIDEADRRKTIFLTTGYKWSLAESVGENNVGLSLHIGYDSIKGTFKRVFLNIKEKPKFFTYEIFLWGLAEIAALTWIFFKSVDLINLERSRYFILGYRPRKIIKPEDLKIPDFLSKIS